MKIYLLSLWLLVTIVHCLPNPQPLTVTQLPGYTQLTEEHVRHLQNRGFGSTIKSFRPTLAYREIEEDVYDNLDSEAESSQDRMPTLANQNYPVQFKSAAQATQNYPLPIARSTLAKAYTVTPKYDRRAQQQYIRRGEEEETNRLEEEKEEEEPDRLSLLLPKSRFNCNAKTTGYYADEELGCEVFHYCQDNAKHSWICPDQFTFHQVHLICMPPSSENICEKSADYHFVNDFLYKPVNLEEFQHKPNVTLRYSDRYYPDAYRSKYEREEQEPIHHQHSIRVPVTQRIQHGSPATIRSQASTGQVFRSPEEINISLQQRRPVQYTTAKYSDY